MANRRMDTETKQKDVLSLPGGWLVFHMGWTANEPTPAHAHERGPFFDSIADMRTYYLANRDRVLEEVGMECWAFHAFECESPDCPECAFFREKGYFTVLDDDQTGDDA